MSLKILYEHEGSKNWSVKHLLARHHQHCLNNKVVLSTDVPNFKIVILTGILFYFHQNCKPYKMLHFPSCFFKLQLGIQIHIC